MGYMTHHAVLVTGPVEMEMELRPDVDGFRAALPEVWRPLVVGPIPAVVNNYVTYVFAPDGSKEGWADSDLGDQYRQQFADLFADKDGWSAPDVVIVRYGGDDPESASVTNPTDTEYAEEPPFPPG